MRLTIILAILMGGLSLISCTTLPIKDSAWFGSKAELGAHEFHTMTTETRNLTREEWLRIWDDLSHPMVCTSIQTFADWKKFMEKACSFPGVTCTYQTQAAVERFFSEMFAENH
jgi:hypothetical protein